MPDVRRDVTERLTGVQRDAMERVVRKLHESPGANKNTAIVGKSVDDIVDLFWDEFKAFRNKTAPFDKEARWNSMHALSGKSHLWHEKYSLPYTIVLGFIGCRTTSNVLGIGPCERNWGDVKNIKTGKRSHMSGEATEKRAILYSSALMAEGRIKRETAEKLDGRTVSNMFNDDDMK
jgi:hypothetical protein